VGASADPIALQRARLWLSSTSYHRSARNLKNTKIREIKSLIKTERSHIAFAIVGISHDGNRDICS
jgi:hypothetical protein